MTPKCHVVLSVCLVFFWVGGWEERWDKIQFTGGINFFYIYIYFSFSGKLQSHNEESSRGSSQGKKTD